jgi:hypothetical protein
MNIRFANSGHWLAAGPANSEIVSYAPVVAARSNQIGFIRFFNPCRYLQRGNGPFRLMRI